MPALLPSPTPVIGTDSHAVESLDSSTSRLLARPRAEGPYVESGGAGLKHLWRDRPGRLSGVGECRPADTRGADPLC